MGSSDPTQSPNLQLFLYSLPSTPQEAPLEMPTPPRKNSASIPFEWEEAPGKPRPCLIKNPENMAAAQKPCLDLPPRMMMLINNLPSPTTVLDGPYNAHGCKSLSFRKIEGAIDGKEKIAFRSCRWGSFRDDKEDFDVGDTNGKVNVTRVRRRKSFLGVSTSTRSSLLATIFEGFKQVVPWKRRQQKDKKIGHSIDFYH